MKEISKYLVIMIFLSLLICTESFAAKKQLKKLYFPLRPLKSELLKKEQDEFSKQDCKKVNSDGMYSFIVEYNKFLLKQDIKKLSNLNNNSETALKEELEQN